MGEVIWIEDEEELINLLKDANSVVIDFTAPGWCIPCRRFAPHFDKAAEQLPGTTFVAVDVDKAPWAAASYGVQSVPTVVQYNGEKFKHIKARAVVPLVRELSE